MSKTKFMFRFLTCLALLASPICYALSGKPKSQETKIEDFSTHWVQYSNADVALFRYATENKSSACPTVAVDGKNFQSKEREFVDDLGFYPIKVCQLELAQGTKEVLFNDSRITLPTATKDTEPKNVSFLGDTGCLVAGKLWEQDCSDPDEYPFAKVAQSIANSKPDLAVHVGDYWYSEKECSNKEKCGSRLAGDNWASWKIDFLASAEPLLKSTPMIFARGNHELCNMGGVGYSILLDPNIEFHECREMQESYSLETAGIRFLMLDSASAVDFKKDPQQPDWQKGVDKYREQFDLLSRLADQPTAASHTILVTHRPIFSLDKRSWEVDSKLPMPLNQMLQEAWGSSKISELVGNIPLIVSGHTHAALSFNLKNSKTGAKLQQVVSGNGGSSLTKTDLLEQRPSTIAGYEIVDHFHSTTFGFFNVEFRPDSLTPTFKGVDGSTNTEYKNAESD